MTLIDVLMIISAILLFVSFFRGQNAIWGGATAGVVIGVIVGLVRGDFAEGLMWGFAIGTLSGSVTDLVGTLGDRLQGR